MRKRTWVSVVALLAVACGGDDSTPINPADGGGDSQNVPDTSIPDTSIPDTSIPDTSIPDGSASDASDASSSDATTDASSSDAASDASSSDAAADAGCDTVGSPWHYVVDPTNGSDGSSSTGSGKLGGSTNSACAFKTVTHAIAALLVANNPPLSGTQITILGASTVSAGETFPIPVPKNVLINSSGGTVTVQPGAGKDAFLLATTGSALDSLTLDGQAHAATRGIDVTSGSDATTKITNVIVKDFSDVGIRLDGSNTALTVGDGVQVAGNTKSGLYATSSITDGGASSVHAIVTGTSTQILFKNNGEFGIKIDTTAYVTITGTLGNTPPTSATVLLDSNAMGGLWIQQTPNNNNPPPLSSIAGLASVGATSGSSSEGNGVHVFGGSQMKLRGSYILGNAGNGVMVTTYPQNITGASDVSGIDLGASSNDYGFNTVQNVATPNQGAGICLNLTQALNQNLKALGNRFAANIDCSAAVSALSKGMCNLGSKEHVGISGSQNNAIATSMCTN